MCTSPSARGAVGEALEEASTCDYIRLIQLAASPWMTSHSLCFWMGPLGASIQARESTMIPGRWGCRGGPASASGAFLPQGTQLS